VGADLFMWTDGQTDRGRPDEVQQYAFFSILRTHLKMIPVLPWPFTSSCLLSVFHPKRFELCPTVSCAYLTPLSSATLKPPALSQRPSHTQCQA